MRKVTAGLIICLGTAVIILGFEVVKARRAQDPPKLNTAYQAVLLDNGQVYYGELSQLGGDYLELTNVFYIVRSEDPKTKQVKNVLVKRGKELHGPTETFLNARHVIMIEPVGPNSEVARLIAESDSQAAK
jgi:hypothetical protein